MIETREGGAAGWSGGGECLFVVSGFYGCVYLERRGGREGGHCIQNDVECINRSYIEYMILPTCLISYSFLLSPPLKPHDPHMKMNRSS